MNEQPPKQSMKDDVLKVIQSGRVSMRPKWQFIIRTALLLVGLILLALTTLYLASFIVFMLRQTGVWFIPGFGFRDLGLFLTSLPWMLVIIALVFMILLEVLIKQYSFVYGRPFMYSALGVIAVVILGGVVIGYTSFHKNLFDRAENGRLPFGGPFYHQFGQPPQNVTVGKITAITNNGYEIQGPRDEIFMVTMTSQTQIPAGSNFNVGDVVVVIGQRQGTTIPALEIQKPDHVPPPSHRPHFEF